jgi:alkylated DNA repair dioxygenase AlkB
MGKSRRRGRQRPPLAAAPAPAPAPATAFRAAERRFRAAKTVAEALALGCFDPLGGVRQETSTGSSSTGGAAVPTTIAMAVPGAPAGLTVVASALCASERRDLELRCLREFHLKPNRTNLDGTGHSFLNAASVESAAVGSPAAATDAPTGPGFPEAGLRWATLGFQYDWTARRYYAGRHVPLPEALAKVTRRIAAMVVDGQGDRGDRAASPRPGCGDAAPGGFAPDAAIINYYARATRLCGHVDDAELDCGAPIVSISLGLPCVFLAGGATRATPPAAVLLRAGDAVVMAGDARTCVHGVPAVLLDSSRSGSSGGGGGIGDDPGGDTGDIPNFGNGPGNDSIGDSVGHSIGDSIGDSVGNSVGNSIGRGTSAPNSQHPPRPLSRAERDYLESHRININVRQVLPRGRAPADIPEHEWARGIKHIVGDTG